MLQESIISFACLQTLLGICSNSNAVGNAIWGKVVVRELFVLVALGDGVDNLIQILAEFCHSLFHWLLHEVFIWVHAQKELIEKQQESKLRESKDYSVSTLCHPADQHTELHKRYPFK